MPSEHAHSYQLGRSLVRAGVVVAALAVALWSAQVAAQDAPWTAKPAPAKPPAKPAPAKPPAKPAPAKPVAKPAPAKPAAKPAPAKPPAKPAPAKPAAKPAPAKPLALAGASAEPEAATGDSIDDAPPDGLDGLVRHFYQQLAPHGRWAQHDIYGLVWLPAESEVGKGFAPYRTDGRWAVTEAGDWAWVSDKEWGKIPFHYGRWVWTRDEGWAWIPGSEHAPAWVVWRLGEPGTDHVGWAPMAPSYYWIDGAQAQQQTGVLPFWFVPSSKLFSPDMARHVVKNPALGARIYQKSRIFSGHLSEAGPDAPLRATTPTLEQARIADEASPTTRLPLDDPAISPIVLPEPPSAEPEPEAVQGIDAGVSRFATPPSSASPAGRWVRRPQSHDPRPRYRCWWTNTRPRIWRCGY